MTWQDIKDFLDSAPHESLKRDAKIYDGVEHRIFNLVDITTFNGDTLTKNLGPDEDIVLIY